MEKWKIYDIFHMLVLEHNTIKRKQGDKTMSKIEFNKGSKEYEIETIHDLKVYTKKTDNGQLPKLHYLVSWKSYLVKKNI